MYCFNNPGWFVTYHVAFPFLLCPFSSKDVEKERELRTEFSNEEIWQRIEQYNLLTKDHLKMTLVSVICTHTHANTPLKRKTPSTRAVLMVPLSRLLQSCAGSKSQILRFIMLPCYLCLPPAPSIPQCSHQSDVMLFLLLFSPRSVFIGSMTGVWSCLHFNSVNSSRNERCQVKLGFSGC